MIRTVTKATQASCSTQFARLMPISLPAEPFTVPEGPDETAPRSLPIRGAFDWRKDRSLRHAERIAR